MRAAFTTYTEAALGRDGAGVVAVTASPIFDFYERARQSALTATEDELAQQSLVERLTAYTLRAEVPVPALRDDSPQELVTTAVERGLVGDEGIRNVALGEVKVDGDEATGQLVAGGQATPLQARFLREDGVWKLDLTSLLEVSEDAFEAAAQQQGLDVEQLIMGA